MNSVRIFYILLSLGTSLLIVVHKGEANTIIETYGGPEPQCDVDFNNITRSFLNIAMEVSTIKLFKNTFLLFFFFFFSLILVLGFLFLNKTVHLVVVLK